MTDIPPVHSLVAAVMQGVGEPALLLEKGASEHHYQLNPARRPEIAGAGLVVWVGPALTPWLEGALANRPEGAASLVLLEAEGTYVQDYGAAAEAGGHDHAHEHGHDDEAKADDHDEGHDHADDGLDPHAWLDPANGKAWVGAIAAELSRLDPENAATYAANAAAAVAAIDAADAEAAACWRR